tara:strand:- start:597 stop:2180 length:1584 start_codon:yes stop_codon:yes gene_type:complete
MRKIFLLLILNSGILFAQSASFDNSILIESQVDTTSFKIGEKIDYYIKISIDNNYDIKFSEKPNFLPFEVLDSFEEDTILDNENFSIIKKYSLINFEPGEFWIPPQRILFNNSVKYSDSLLIIINDVEVDTVKQNLYNIKPIIPIKRNYTNILTVIFFILLLLLVVWYLIKNRSKESWQSSFKANESFYEIAIKRINKLKNISPKNQNEFKEFYTNLVDSLRQYLEFQFQIPAMESTSSQLLIRIKVFSENKNYKIENKSLKDLEKLFSKSDLIKFAKSLPSKNEVSNDIETISSFIKKVNTFYIKDLESEIDSDNLNTLYEKEKNSFQFKKFAYLFTGVILSILLFSFLIFGYYPVRDTLLLHPTRKLYKKEWYTSQYGSPPVEIETPEILFRSEDTLGITKFNFGDSTDPFFIELKFNDVIKGQQVKDLNALLNNSLEKLQGLGAKNILMNDETFTIKSGDTGYKFFGSLDFGENNSLIRSSFTSIVLPYDQVTISLTIIYIKEDRYSDKVERRILESLNLIKEL